MAAAVARAFERGGVLLAEAGTGTGKTLAYLVPAILSRQRVLVSTGTKTLQEQIYFKDIPALRDALGIPFTAAYMKGRANYLCLHRLEQLGDENGPAPLAVHDVFLPVIREWSTRTETGDRAELEDLPEDIAFWNEVSATAETCLGTECPRYRGLLRHQDAAARRGRRRGDRQPSPALRGCSRPEERVRRGDSRVRQRDRRRGAPARRRGDAVFRLQREHVSVRRARAGYGTVRTVGCRRAKRGRRRNCEGDRPAARPRAHVLQRHSPSRTAGTAAPRAKSACGRRSNRLAPRAMQPRT